MRWKPRVKLPGLGLCTLSLRRAGLTWIRALEATAPSPWSPLNSSPNQRRKLGLNAPDSPNTTGTFQHIFYVVSASQAINGQMKKWLEASEEMARRQWSNFMLYGSFLVKSSRPYALGSLALRKRTQPHQIRRSGRRGPLPASRTEPKLHILYHFDQEGRSNLFRRKLCWGLGKEKWKRERNVWLQQLKECYRGPVEMLSTTNGDDGEEKEEQKEYIQVSPNPCFKILCIKNSTQGCSHGSFKQFQPAMPLTLKTYSSIQTCTTQ